MSNKILENIGDTGQTTRKVYQRRLPSDTSRDYYFMHRNTGVTEPVIVEYGFIDDSSNNVNFLNNNYQSLAESVIKAVADYKGIPYMSPSGMVIGGEASTYTVKRGDSLYSIAQRYGTTVDNLKSLNGLTSNLLSIGQILKIPSSSSTVSYKVKSGDSLYAIAQRYGTTVNEIKNLNNLTSNTLRIGQILKIPSNVSGGISSGTTGDVSGGTDYTVKSGDTLYLIAQKYGLNVDDIINLNDLSSMDLLVGQVIKLPVDQIIDEEDADIDLDIDGDINSSDDIVTYTVKSGDTLYSIARNYGVSVDSIKNANGLTSNLLSIGQILEIPSGTTSNLPTTYTVQSGDTLYSIARKFDTSVANLKSLNNLSSNLLSIGQKLILR